MKPNASAIHFERNAEPAEDDQIIRTILSAVRSVAFGSVEIVIQNSRIVQIERKEKFRFDRI
jgi:hypothetical protein